MTTETQVQVPAVRNGAREVRTVQDTGPLSFLMDTARFEHMYRVATAMAAGSFIPAHVRGKSKDEAIGNCFRIVNQAMRWGFDPFAVVDETYVVSGKLGYEGKLIAAVINARAGLATGLRVVYNSKSGDDLAAVVYGSNEREAPAAVKLLRKYVEDDDRAALSELTALGVYAVRISVGQSKTSNDMWRKDPEQKLFYSGATKWARRHRPEIVLGVLTDDDLERIALQSPVPQQPQDRFPARENLRRPNGPPVSIAAPGEIDVADPPSPDDVPQSAPAETPPETSAQDSDASGQQFPDAAPTNELEENEKDISASELVEELGEAATEADLYAAGRKMNDRKAWYGEARYQRLQEAYTERWNAVAKKKKK